MNDENSPASSVLGFPAAAAESVRHHGEAVPRDRPPAAVPLGVPHCLDQIAAAAAEEAVLFHAGRRPVSQGGPSLTELRESLAAHFKTLTSEPLRAALDDVCRSILRLRAWTNSPSGAGMGSPRVGAEVDKELTRLQDLVTVARGVMSANDGNASLPGSD